jgi:23S rRNA pseudouridine2605 synthase
MRKPAKNNSKRNSGKKEDSGKKKSFSFKDKKSGGSDKKRFSKKNEESEGSGKKKFSFKDKDAKESDKKRFSSKDKPYKKFDKKHKPAAKTSVPKNDGLIRLNKYIANAGVCSRREADTLIESGVVTVNGKVVTAMGTKISPTDEVSYGGERLKNEKLVYLLLNKPKDFITTTDDPKGRRTVMMLVSNACKERIVPVGRLDRNTTGLLLFTNDGDIAKKLTHPKHTVQKIYHVFTDKNVKGTHLDELTEGIHLEDGFSKADSAAFTGKDKNQVGVEMHTGKNRIVRRLFEHLGYKVTKLDRVMFAGLTKKDLPRGRWRFLTEKEIAFLKMIK